MLIRLFIMGVAALAVAATPSISAAWGGDGHRLVADYAAKRLIPDAKAEVERLLALEPGTTLASISTWADEVRSPTTAAWHYVNFRREADCKYTEAGSCPGGNCVVAAIDRQLAVLASKARDEDRLKALKYVVHFIADVHQPLHAGYFDDRGGNTFQLQANGRGTNLHSVWDSGLLLQWPGGLPALSSAMEAEPLNAAETEAAVWAEESCQVVAADGFYPEGHKLDAECQATRETDPLATLRTDPLRGRRRSDGRGVPSSAGRSRPRERDDIGAAGGAEDAGAPGAGLGSQAHQP